MSGDSEVVGAAELVVVVVVVDVAVVVVVVVDVVDVVEAGTGEQQLGVRGEGGS